MAAQESARGLIFLLKTHLTSWYDTCRLATVHRATVHRATVILSAAKDLAPQYRPGDPSLRSG